MFNESLRVYIDVLESFSELGALQGVILRLNESGIDSSGLYLTDIMMPVPFYEHVLDLYRDRVVICSAVEGTCPIFRINALSKAFASEKIFEESFYGFGEDIFTSIRLWRAGYKIAFISRPVAKHKRGATWRSSEALYYSARNFLAMTKMFSGVRKQFIRTLTFLRGSYNNPKAINLLFKAYIDSDKLMKKLLDKYERQKLPEEMPLIKISPMKEFSTILLRRTLVSYVNQIISKNINRFTIARI